MTLAAKEFNPIFKLEKRFSNFRGGLEELMALSFSAEQALTMGDTDPRRADDPEEAAIIALALNAAFDRPTGNGVGWGQCKISITAFGVDYTTTGGLRFGWDIYPATPPDDDFWTFHIIHPDGVFHPGSTLLASATEKGWKE